MPTKRGIKRRVTHDSVIDADFHEPSGKARKQLECELLPPNDGPVLEAAYLAAEAAARRYTESPRVNIQCQVCGLDQEKWHSRVPLFLNAAEQPVRFPGHFCSKECFEHI